jgi:H/ACA ribonucleoprotein complex subunit 2
MAEEEHQEKPQQMEGVEGAAVESTGDGAPTAKKRKLVPMDYEPPLLIPIANPLANERLSKRVFKLVAKATADKKIRRGVKEVVKSIRKEKTPDQKRRLCVIAADITPIDVITHIPVLCEENAVPYVYVRSRAVLGQAARTKRPTSVVLVNLPLDSPHDALFARCESKIKALQPSFA